MTVFISHSFKDKPEFDNVAESLEHANVDYWQPSEVTSAGSLRDQLRSAIAQCNVCIFIATRNSADSSWCGAELGAFWGSGTPIIVYLAEPSLPEGSLSPILEGDVWERRLARVAARAKELTQAGQDPTDRDDTSPPAQVSNLTVSQLELLIARAVTTATGDNTVAQASEIETITDGQDHPDRPQVTLDRRKVLIEERPHKWEYQLWSLILSEGVGQLEDKWQAFQSRTSNSSTMVLNARNIKSFPSDVIATLQESLDEINDLFSRQTKEIALGAPGEVGNPTEIERMAEGLIGVYERLIDWSSELRGAQVTSRYANLVQIAAEIPRQPAQQIRDFVHKFSTGMEEIAADKPINLDLTLTISLDSATLDRFVAEFQRVR